MRYTELLQEGTSNYMNMFDGLSRLIDKVVKARTGEDSGIWQEEFQKHFRDHVNWARKTLRRKDRITWYLRLCRIGFVCHVIEHYEAELLHKKHAQQSSGANQQQAEIAKEKEHDAMEEIRDILFKDYNERFGVDLSQGRIPERLAGMWRGFDRDRYVHAMQMMPQIPKLDAIRWGAQPPDALIDRLRNIEAEWQQEQREDASIIQPDTDKTLIQFPDGNRWVRLNRGGCPIEARAGGHCGNGTDRGDGTNILSLRTPNKKKGKKNQWKVLCTFILDPRGVLGEMKARFNQKPENTLHPHIMELLKNPIIKGIKGGGYLPERNFAFSDINEQQREDVLTHNLFPVMQHEGGVPRMQSQCEHDMRQNAAKATICVKCGQPDSGARLQ